MTSLRLLGYWREDLPEPRATLPAVHAAAYASQRARGRRWPDPAVFVDPAWAPGERAMVVHYLQTGTVVARTRGLSACRLCGCDNGSTEMADEAFCWPEGLAHYVEEHYVCLPAEFISHLLPHYPARWAMPTPAFDSLGQRDRSWQPGGCEADLNQSFPPADEERDADIDPAWWIKATVRDATNQRAGGAPPSLSR